MPRLITQATLRNMPTYLAEARARRAEESAEKERAERRKREEALKKRMAELGAAFASHEDFTPQGIQSFAQQNQMTLPEEQMFFKMMGDFKALAPKPQKQERVPNIWSVKGGIKTRVADVPGVTSEVGTSSAGEPKVPDWMRFGRDTLKASLGFNAQTGWPDPEAQRKFDTVLANVDRNMQGKDPSSIISVLHEETTKYDAEQEVGSAIKKIPANTFLKTVGDAKKAVETALQSGATPDSVKIELQAKGWDDKEIKKIMSGEGTSTSNPLGL